MRALGALFFLLVPLAACASKVGERGPTRITALDPSLELRFLDGAQVARLCIDVKSTLGAERRQRAQCVVQSIFLETGTCKDNFDTCMSLPAGDALGRVDDCEP